MAAERTAADYARASRKGAVTREKGKHGRRHYEADADGWTCTSTPTNPRMAYGPNGTCGWRNHPDDGNCTLCGGEREEPTNASH